MRWGGDDRSSKSLKYAKTNLFLLAAGTKEAAIAPSQARPPQSTQTRIIHQSKKLGVCVSKVNYGSLHVRIFDEQKTGPRVKARAARHR